VSLQFSPQLCEVFSSGLLRCRARNLEEKAEGALVIGLLGAVGIEGEIGVRVVGMRARIAEA